MIFEGSSKEFLATFPKKSVKLIWTDPPFGTNKHRELLSSGASYDDIAIEALLSQMKILAGEAREILTDDGMLAVCLDYRAIHETVSLIKKWLPHKGDIIWHFETGGLAKKWWANKHNVIACFGYNPQFNFDEVPTVARKAPKDGYTEQKKLNSVWNINMSTTDPQRVGYPDQKPLELVERFIRVHTDPGDLVIDPFGGSGTTAKAAQNLGRLWSTSDTNPDAIEVMKKRLL